MVIFTSLGSSSSFRIASFLIRATRWAKRQVVMDSYQTEWGKRWSLSALQQSPLFFKPHFNIPLVHRQGGNHGSFAISSKTKYKRTRQIFLHELNVLMRNIVPRSIGEYLNYLCLYTSTKIPKFDFNQHYWGLHNLFHNHNKNLKNIETTEFMWCVHYLSLSTDVIIEFL